MGGIITAAAEFLIYKMVRNEFFYDLGPTKIHIEMMEHYKEQEENFAQHAKPTYHMPGHEREKKDEDSPLKDAHKTKEEIWNNEKKETVSDIVWCFIILVQ